MRVRFRRRSDKHGRRIYGRDRRLTIGPLENVWGRLGRERNGRGERAYSDAVGLGIGVLAMVVTISLLFWLTRRITRETVPSTPEEGVEDAPLGTVPPGSPRAEDISPTEEPPPGGERPEKRGVTSTTPPTPQEEPPSGEEQSGRQTP